MTDWKSVLQRTALGEAEKNVLVEPLNLSPPPGFQGLHPNRPVTRYIRHLPHWRQEGATYFVTFRLADSLPKEKLEELRRVKEEWERKHPHPRGDAEWELLSRATTQRVEHWLDQGFGSCALADAEAASKIVESMSYFDNERYELDSYVVMANHVHLLIRPLEPSRFPLEKILQSWKTYAARKIRLQCRSMRAFWQQESFDRIVRDAEHLYRCIQYIGRNPRRAGCSHRPCPLWVRPEWDQLGWRFEPV